MELRIVRSHKMVRDPSKPVRYGGPPALIRKSVDTLQMRVDGGEWENVPVVLQKELENRSYQSAADE